MSQISLLLVYLNWKEKKKEKSKSATHNAQLPVWKM